jgi:hypothetical protein
LSDYYFSRKDSPLKEKKRTKVMVATNIYQIDPVVYSGHLHMFHALGKADDEIETIFFGPWRMAIDMGRNNAAARALRWDCDYLLFYDDDMYFPRGSDIVKMIKKIRDSNGEISAIQALAFIRGYPFKPMCFKAVDVEGTKTLSTYDDYKEHIQEDGLVKCEAVGCCATIIDCNLFKMTPQPWFMTGQGHTEDIYFFVKAQQFVGNVNIYMDTTVEIGHLLDKPILTESNVPILKSLFEGNNINQLFLPDPNYVPMIKASKAMSDVEEERPNPLTVLDQIKFREET